MESFNPRIKKVLDKLVDPNFKLKDDAYLNLLLTHLTTADSDGQVKNPFLLDWLVDVITKWAKTNKIPKPHILAFTTNLLRSFCDGEEIFVKLKNVDVFEYLLQISNYAMFPSPQPSVELALMKLLYSFMDHDAGLHWMISGNHWEIPLRSALNSHTVYISKEGCKCIARLLVATTPKNGTLCKNIIQLILAPLIEASDRVTAGDMVAAAINDALHKSLSPTVQLVIEILLGSLKNQVCSNEKEIILRITEQYGLEKCVQKLISKAEDEDFIHDLYKILIILGFFDMHFKSYNKKVIRSDQIDSTTAKLFDVINDAVSKGPVTTVLKIIFTSLDYWQIMEETAPVWVSAKQIDLSFKDQLMVLQLLPATPFSIEKMRFHLEDYEENECRSRFMQNLIDHVIPTTVRICYKWRPHLNQNDSISYGTMGLKYFLHSKKYYKRKNAILAFRSLTHMLMDVTFSLEKHPDLITYFLRQPEYFTLLLECITVVIEEFSITWRDSTDTFCVLQAVYHFLNKSTWPSRVVVKGLKLADVSISRYMSPQMAFLIDNIDSSTITPFATMLNVKLHDGEWEVRDSAIELICTMTRTANTKFSSFRKPLSENDFPCVILNMALVDGSSFVRATAFKCLQEMIQVSEFWHILSTKGDILEKTLKILHIEPEGIVRTEAAVLIHYMFRYQDIPEDILSKFYDAMTHAVVADLHWEVRVKALHFWKTVIEHHLTQQGMIDGTFPTFTFSKEHRKIVNLNEDQIKKDLIKVLHLLSLNGCLAVFHTALQDQCDIEVSKYATNTIKDFVTLLKKYKITSSEAALGTVVADIGHHSDVFSKPDLSCFPAEISDNSMENVVQHEVPLSADKVLDDLLEDILNSQDINLLQSVFNSRDQPTHDYLQMKGRTVLPPKDFVNFIYSNFECCTNDKVKWVEGIDNFDSLLDDILKEYDVDDVNSMDCY